jgi:hypothetical protein
MFRRKTKLQALSPFIDHLTMALSLTGLKPSRTADTLTVRHPNMVTYVKVSSPDERDSADGRIEGVVQIRTELPPELATYFADGRLVASANAMATVGAITRNEGGCFVGSRLTVFEEENTWDVQIPLVLLSTLGAAESILGALRRTIRNEKPEGGASAWIDEDFNLAHSTLSRFCVCTTEVGLTAEFALEAGSVGAVSGQPRTALWQLRPDVPHPHTGGGLLCTLHLPPFDNVGQIANELNQMEMAPRDLVPHFGAWCQSHLGGLA